MDEELPLAVSFLESHSTTDYGNLREVLANLEMLADQTEVRAQLAVVVQRLDRLELMLGGLKAALVASRIVSEHSINLATARLDLADGIEDGRIGPLQASKAPPCPQCAKPLNPKRTQCIFCGVTITRAEPAPKEPEPTVSCAACGNTVPQRSTWYSEMGVLCDPCHHSVDLG